tara:strand:+ start:1254 stop:2303 length:1050 start_codon:yes stop_codon:yes gene_type:complete
MAYTTVNKSSSFQNQVLYTGNESTRSETGVGFQPDFTWIKVRSRADPHILTDAVRGTSSQLSSDTTGAQQTFSNMITSFNSDGFSLGANVDVNRNSETFVAWNWKANGAGSANTDGGINSTVSVNNTAGFSIVKYGTGTGSATTVGHGMNTTPNFIMIKPLGTVTTGGWIVGGDNIDNTWNNVLELNSTAAKASDPSFNNTAPTSSVFSVGNNNTNRSGENYIAYCFANVRGFSKMGIYTGNGSTNGNFIYTGFRPSFIMIKRITDGSEAWVMFDNKRANSFNGVTGILKPNLSEAETTQGAGPSMDFLSNGIKLTNTDGSFNNSGIEFIYMAFGQSLVGTNNIPNNAR